MAIGEKRIRKSFSKIPSAAELPDLLDIQLMSFHDFLQHELAPQDRESQGLQAVFEGVFPIVDSRENFELEFIEYYVDPPKYSVIECQERGTTFSVSLKAKLRLSIKDEYDAANSLANSIFIVLFIISLLLAVFLYPEISRKVDYIDYFPSSDKIVSDTYKIFENSGGGQSLNITFKAPAGAENHFLQKDVMNQIEDLQDAISNNENVIGLMSFYTILEQINGVMFNRNGLPEKQGLILLLSRYFKLMGDRDITYAADADFIDSEFSQITIFLKVFDGKTGKVIADRDILHLIDDLQAMIDVYIPDTETSYIWGNTVLFFEAGNQIQHDQLFSTLLAMILIVFVSMIFFRSLLLGMLSLIPLVFASKSEKS